MAIITAEVKYMKKYILLLFVPIIVLFSGCSMSLSDNKSYLRIHIRANSNSEEDQNIKYKVRDLIVTYITPKVENMTSKDQVIDLLNNENHSMTLIVNEFLKENDFDYGCNISINNEFFPTRTYEDLTLDADYYDALIINLGSGTGNNWWCVVYPPLCFKGEGKVVYKSKIKEIIEKIWG